MYRRNLMPLLQDALSDSPVVLLNGARQTGKTTLVQALAEKQQSLAEKQPLARTYLSLDDAGVLSAARSDPAGFLAGFPGPLVIDEVQHAPELFPAIKSAVDKRREPGRFLLTGSANVLLLPRLSESLAGRMEILTLWPLAQSEIENKSEIENHASGRNSSLIDLLFGGTFSQLLAPGLLPEVPKADLIRRLVAGGYPEPLARTSDARRRAWFGSYLTTILQRDVRDMANIEGLTALPRLLSLLAARSGMLLNLADVSRTSGLAYTTLLRYMTLLEATFLVQLLPSWSANLGHRLVKSPKLLISDTGLAVSLLGVTAERLAENGTLLGGLLETFVAMELRKAAGWSAEAVQLFHYRTQAGQEVDVLLENGMGQLVGVEVKASATVTSSDFKGLRGIAEATGDRFVRGVVLYTGSQVIPFGERLYAVPMSVLWHL
jgi:predicted AAA+ superfamily ATPase